MRTTRSIFAALFAVALVLPFSACETQETEFQETPPAEEEVEVMEEQRPTTEQDRTMDQDGAMQEEPLQDEGTGDQM